MRKLLVLVVLLLAGCQLIMMSVERDQARVLSSVIKDSVVQLLMIGDNGGGRCTAFSVGNGKFLTAQHCVRGATTLIITRNDKQFIAELVKQDIKNDIALLVVNKDKLNLKAIPLGVQVHLKVGQTVFAIGHPYGFKDSVTKGIISAFRGLVFQLDLSVHPGNSGGPIINSSGELISIASRGIPGSVTFGPSTKAIKEFLKE